MGAGWRWTPALTAEGGPVRVGAESIEEVGAYRIAVGDPAEILPPDAHRVDVVISAGDQS